MRSTGDCFILIWMLVSVLTTLSSAFCMLRPSLISFSTTSQLLQSVRFDRTTTTCRLSVSSATLLENENLTVAVADGDATSDGPDVDRRPHEQRVDGPRKARRLNHPFQHLYRHPDPRWDDNDLNEDVSADAVDFYDNSVAFAARASGEHQCNSTFAQQAIDRKTSLLAIEYLHRHGGFTFDEILSMHGQFPPLLEMSVERHFRPKMRFLKDCLGGETDPPMRMLDPQLKSRLPANFFGSRLERTIAPRHAFLVHLGLPSGKSLWDDTHDRSRGDKVSSLLEEFLLNHRKPKQFAAMCNKWRNLYGSTLKDNLPITSEQIVAFDKLIQRGILSAARDDSAYAFKRGNESEIDNGKGTDNSPSLLRTADVTSSQLIRYLIQHGSNPWETDARGASLFHWASGCGNMEGLRALVECCNQQGSTFQGREAANTCQGSPGNELMGTHAALLWRASRDDATPLHWAAAGASPKEFGIGGHIAVCNYLLSLCKEHSIMPERQLMEFETKDGNTVLMWAAWSSSLDIVKLLVRSRANTSKTNRNGCSVAHWAASGGDLSVCQYLHKMANVDFTVENFARNTPLSHAVAYGRFEVVRWLKEDLKVEDVGGSAADLALDFVNWAEMGLIGNEDEEKKRQSVSSLFNSFNDWKRESEQGAVLE